MTSTLKKENKVCRFCSRSFQRDYRQTVKSWELRVLCSRDCWGKEQGIKQRGKVVPKGEESHAWKGDMAKYQAIHIWVRKEKGSAGEHNCVDCGNRAHEWSNIDSNYRRVLDDYESRCRSCHRRKDGNTLSAWKTRREKQALKAAGL